MPVAGGGVQDFRPGQSSSSVARSPVDWLNTEDEAFQVFFFALFPTTKKSATVPPHSGSELPPHSSPWTPAAYDAPMALEEEEEESEYEPVDVQYFEFEGRWWWCEWVPALQYHCWWLAAADGSQAGRATWRPPWLGRGPG